MSYNELTKPSHRAKVVVLARELRAIPIVYLTPRERAMAIRANLRSYAHTVKMYAD